jgi:prepilin-type N-terminal cleavage/methylation domain-containing protein
MSLPTSRRGTSTPDPRGMTLVEMLVAMASTLILLGLVAQLFSLLGSGVNGSRNAVEMNDRLRIAATTLRHDLFGATALGRTPPLDPSAGLGYFEVIEGSKDDLYYVTNRSSASNDLLVGDCDDVLLFTTRAVAEPFTGKIDQAYSIQSPYADVIYFCTLMPNTSSPRMCSLHRRQRLVMGHPNAGGFGSGVNTAPPAIAAVSDISSRLVAGVFVPNTLGDLTKRENRSMRAGPPRHDLNLANPLALALGGDPSGADVARYGEDIILTNVIAFDVKVFDPFLKDATGLVGVYRDLSIPPSNSFGNYDTWSTTSDAPPPIPLPLRGIEVTIRCYDPASRKVRQTTIRHAL